jgi:hypothetical protein
MGLQFSCQACEVHAEIELDPSCASTLKVIHNFGRADTVDRDALARLVASISRFLDPEPAIAAAHTGEIDILDSRRLGGAWVLDQLWERLGVGAALHRVAADRRLDADATERVLFALVAQRALEPAPPTAPISPAAAGTTSTPRPPPHWPAPAVTTPWPTTCGSQRFGWHPAAAPPTGRAPNGSWCATTRMPPTATPRCATASSRTSRA